MSFMLKVLGCLIAGCVSLWCSSGWADEVLLKVACVPERVLQKNIVSRETVFSSQYNAVIDPGVVLNIGVKSDNESTEDGPYAESNPVSNMKFREARSEIKKLFFSMGRVTGKQLASSNSVWNKFIISFQGGDSPDDYILEVGSEGAEISHVAVADQEGTYKLWQISTQAPSRGDTATAYRIQSSDLTGGLLRDDARTWFYERLPGTYGVGVMVVTQDSANAFPKRSDTALIWIQRGGLLPVKQGVPAVAIIIGWKSRFRKVVNRSAGAG